MKWLISFPVMVVLVSPLSAQVDNASLNGTVTDSSRASVQGARVMALSYATGLRRETMTSAAGAYQLPALAVGRYTITISREGFKAAEFKDVEFTVGQTRTIDARLEVGSIAESVEVTASLDPLNRSS